MKAERGRKGRRTTSRNGETWKGTKQPRQTIKEREERGSEEGVPLRVEGQKRVEIKEGSIEKGCTRENRSVSLESSQY